MAGKRSASKPASQGAVEAAAAPIVADLSVTSAPQDVVALAEMVATEPERFARADGEVSNLSRAASKTMFDLSVESEQLALPHLSALLHSTFPAVEPTPITRSGKKRKRNANANGAAAAASLISSYHSLFEPTPLSEMVVEGMTADQMWQQLELRGKKLETLISSIIQVEQPADEEDEEEDEDMMDDDEEFDEDDPAGRKLVHSLAELDDAEMRALGLDPAMREELMSMEEEYDDYDDEEEEEDDDGQGYPGTSDLSDEDAGEISFEPLLSEAQQQRRKAAAEAAELGRLRSQTKLRRLMAAQSGQDDGEGLDEDDWEDEDLLDDEDEDGIDQELVDMMDTGSDSEGDDEEDDEEESEDEESAEMAEHRRRISILDNLDAPGGAAAASRKAGARHPTLDDDFFSIDEFNRLTEEQEREAERKERLPAEEEEDVNFDDEIDLFKSVDDAEEDELDEDGLPNAADLRYADFFLPPPRLTKGSKGKGKGSSNAGKGKGKAKQDDATPAVEVDVSAAPPQAVKRKTSVRFSDQVAVRRIKARRKDGLKITPEMLRALGATQEDIEQAELEMEEEEDEEDDDEEEGEFDDDDDDDEDGEGFDEEDEEDEEDDEGDVLMDDAGELEEETQTAKRVTGDLFADEPAGDTPQQSSHERRMATLQAEIERLEQENVGKRDWTLMGESGARARPQNSLLEEHLEFESAGKAKPLVTEEVTKGLEDLIRARILEGRFDDVVRRRHMEATPFLPSRLLELSDAKSAKSLAQLYEDDYSAAREQAEGQKARTPAADAKLQKEHEEIDAIFDEVCNKLDALSNAHYTPKAPKATIQTISNAPTISLETALPSTSSAATMLAPEEIYDAGRRAVALSGERSELTPEEAQRQHHRLRKEKRARNDRIEETRKALEINAEALGRRPSGPKGKKGENKEKDEALRKLIGNKGVSVIGKGKETGGAKGKGKGSMTPKPASAAAGPSSSASGASFKL